MQRPDRRGLASTSTTDLLALYSSIVDELLERSVVRSTNNPVADYAEYLVARAFGLTLVANASAGYDAIDDDDVRYQVKARRLTARNASRQLGFIRGFDKDFDPFDVIVGILFEADFAVHRAARIPVEVVRSRAKRVEYVNAWRILLVDAVWGISGVVDVTGPIRAAAAESVSAVARVQTRIATPRQDADSPEMADEPNWRVAMGRYRTPRVLHTRARGRSFTVEAAKDHLVITPETGRERRVSAAEFLKVIPLMTSNSRVELLALTFNSSYLEAIADDLAGQQAGR